MKKNINWKKPHNGEAVLCPALSIFFPHAKGSDFKTLNRSFEDYVSHTTDDREEQIKFTVNRAPELIVSTVNHLRHKHSKFTSKAAVTRYLTGYGSQIIQKIPIIKKLREQKRVTYESGTELDRLRLSGNNYDFGKRISITNKKMTVYTFKKYGALIDELATDIGTYKETIVTVSLIAAISSATTWIPNKYRETMLKELERFFVWVTELAEEG